LLLVLIATVAILDRILIPSTRWFLGRRINRVIDEIGTRIFIFESAIGLPKKSPEYCIG
jgi:hypothetical protein